MDIATVIEQIEETRQRALETQVVLDGLAKFQTEMYAKAQAAAEQCGAWFTLDELKALPAEIQGVEQSLISAQLVASEYKRNDLADAQEALEMAVTDASLEAFGSVVDGKNKEQRDVQLSAFLSRNATITTAKQKLRNAENELADLDARISIGEMNLKRSVGEFKAICHAAELQTQLLRIMAG